MNAGEQLYATKQSEIVRSHSPIFVKIYPPYIEQRNIRKLVIDVPDLDFGEGRATITIVNIDPYDGTWDGVLLEALQLWPGEVELTFFNTNYGTKQPRPIRVQFLPYRKEEPVQ